MNRLTCLDDGRYRVKSLCDYYTDKLGEKTVNSVDRCDYTCEMFDCCCECPIQDCFNKLGEYENLEEKFQGTMGSDGVTIVSLVHRFIEILEDETGEKYTGFRILTNHDAILYDKWRADQRKN